jgi:hypothetical protein
VASERPSAGFWPLGCDEEALALPLASCLARVLASIEDSSDASDALEVCRKSACGLPGAEGGGASAVRFVVREDDAGCERAASLALAFFLAD